MTGARSRGREAALQILYLWEIGRTSPEAAVEAYFAQHQPDAPARLREFATELAEGTAAAVGHLDAIIARHARHWRLERLAVVDRLILRLAVFELDRGGDTPPPVIVNEAIELARRFSGEDAVRFVNGVLDGVVRDPTRPPASVRHGQ